MFSTKKSDAAFFDAFSSHAAKSVEAARMLLEMMTHMKPANGESSGIYRSTGDELRPPEVDEQSKRLSAEITEAETAADSITHQTVKRLHENWITPLDRDDIHNLISRMDDVLDLIEAVAERIVLFQVGVVAPYACELAEYVAGACEILGKTIALLPT